MSVTLNLYVVNCDAHTVDKTPYIKEELPLTGNFRGEYNLQNPVIECEGDLSQYNYAEIDGRYYMIISCNHLRTGISILTMRTDVLWTYKDYIYALPAVVNRSYRLVNSYLPDDAQKVVQYTQTVNKNIGNPLDYVVTFEGNTYNSHILVTVG